MQFLTNNYPRQQPRGEPLSEDDHCCNIIRLDVVREGVPIAILESVVLRIGDKPTPPQVIPLERGKAYSRMDNWHCRGLSSASAEE